MKKLKSNIANMAIVLTLIAVLAAMLPLRTESKA